MEEKQCKKSCELNPGKNYITIGKRYTAGRRFAMLGNKEEKILVIVMFVVALFLLFAIVRKYIM
jgi:hypothetical protein